MVQGRGVTLVDGGGDEESFHSSGGGWKAQEGRPAGGRASVQECTVKGWIPATWAWHENIMGRVQVQGWINNFTSFFFVFLSALSQHRSHCDNCLLLVFSMVHMCEAVLRVERKAKKKNLNWIPQLVMLANCFCLFGYIYILRKSFCFCGDGHKGSFGVLQEETYSRIMCSFFLFFFFLPVTYKILQRINFFSCTLTILFVILCPPLFSTSSI